MPLVKRGRVGVIGHRSWIAERLMQRLLKETDCLIIMYDKQRIRDGVPDASERDMSHLDCLYIFAGRAQPTKEEMELELKLVTALVTMDPSLSPKRMVYLSSQSIWDETPYGSLKRNCELKFAVRAEALSVRPGAVFGIEQDLQSPMLVPTLARDDGSTELRTPDAVTTFTWIEDLVSYLITLRDPWYIAPAVWTDVPGSFDMTPRQMQALYNTWKGYRR
jgi:hypothetical protein